MVSATKARQNKTNPNQTKPKNNSALIDNVWKAQSVSGLETVFSPTGVQSGADQFRMSGTMATKSVEFVPFFFFKLHRGGLFSLPLGQRAEHSQTLFFFWL